MGKVPFRPKCRICGKGLGKGKYLVKNLWEDLIKRCGAIGLDGIPYNKEADYLCGRCKIAIKPVGKSLKHPKQLRTQENQNITVSKDVSTTTDDLEVQEPVPEPSYGDNEDEEFHDDNDLQFDEMNEVELGIDDPMENVQAQYSASEGTSAYNSEQFTAAHRTSSSEKKVYLKNTIAVPYTESKCCVCPSRDRSRISKSAIEHFWATTGIWLPTSNRCCPEHIENGIFCEEALASLRASAKPGAHLHRFEIELWTNRLIGRSQESRVTVDSESLDIGDYPLLFGVSKFAFDELYALIKDNLRWSLNRSPRNALAIFLAKIRLDVSHTMLGFLFGLPQRKVNKAIARVAELLEKKFVPVNLGFLHKNREELIRLHGSEFAQKLFDAPPGSLILILDGTYLFTEKSSSHWTQKMTFSGQKGRNLLKVMMIVTPTGYIVDAAGCFFSNGQHNDASILKAMMNGNGGISDLIEDGDVFVLDRGFRDVIKYLEQKNIKTFMPNLLGKGQKQFTQQQADDSRKVTLIRWVVEAANGRLKNMFRFFDNVIPATYFNENCSKKLTRYLRIACAIMNKYCPPLFTDTDEHVKLLEQIKARENVVNSLAVDITDNYKEYICRRGAVWKKYCAKDLQNFPKLTWQELQHATLGKFNLKQSKAYTDDQLLVNHTYPIQLYAKKENVFRVKLRSRFRGQTSHYVWIQFGCGDDEPKIMHHFCQCMQGARSVTACSHIASVLWFLGYHRHCQPNYIPKSIGKDILDVTARKGTEIEPLQLPDSSDVDEMSDED